MADREEQQLLGYLLGVLENTERESIQEQLASDPKLRRHLAQQRKALRPLDMTAQQFAAPEGLAERTCRHVAALAPQLSSVEPHEEAPRPAPATVPPSDVLAAPGRGGSWSWMDLATAAAIFVAATLLLIPAIESSRFNARLVGCQENLRRLGQALGQYSQRHNDYFPPVPQQGPLAAAGVFAPVLASTGYLESPQDVVCPSSPLAEQRHFRVPDVEELLAAGDPADLERLQRRMGGSYGYSLGFMEDGRYQSLRNLRRPLFALMSDAPTDQGPGHQSLNHGGRGQNVLFEDFHVQFYTTPKPSGLPDDFFVNDRGQVAAGSHRDDSVIGSSASAPLRYVGFGRD